MKPVAAVQQSRFLSAAAPLQSHGAAVQQSRAPLKGGAHSAASAAPARGVDHRVGRNISPDRCGRQAQVWRCGATAPSVACLPVCGGLAGRALQRGTSPRPSATLGGRETRCGRLYCRDEKHPIEAAISCTPSNIADRISVSYSVIDEYTQINPCFTALAQRNMRLYSNLTRLLATVSAALTRRSAPETRP